MSALEVTRTIFAHTFVSFPPSDTDFHTKTMRPTTNMTPLKFNNDNGACQMNSCRFRGFGGPFAAFLPSKVRIFSRPSGWLPRRLKTTTCCAEVAIEVIANSSALYQIAITVAWSDALKRATVGHVKDVAITPPKSAPWSKLSARACHNGIAELNLR